MAINLEKLMSHKPTLIGTVKGVKFYEHPVHGDEVGMIAVWNGEALQTDWYDLPRPDDDVETPEDFMKTYRA